MLIPSISHLRVMESNLSDGQTVKRTILVVDDFDDTRLLLRTWLEKRGFRVVEAEDGIKAIATAQEERPDLIIMDVEMPELDGLSATRKIKSIKELRDVPVVAVSAYGAEQFRSEALAAGCQEYVSTPFEPIDLERLIRSLLFALLLMLLIPFGVRAQTACKTKIAELPESAELRGFRLGMTMEQVKARVPQVVFGPTDPLGMSKTTINPYFDPRIDKAGFADIRSVSLDFLDGRLVSLWIGYEETFKWTSVEDFVGGISKALSVPAEWSSWKGRGQQLRCGDFEMTVSMVARGPSLRIFDLAADETLTARRNAAEEAKEAVVEEESTESEEIVGDKKNKIYYPAGCQPATEITGTNRVVFETVEAAEKAGYKRANNCP